MKRYEVCSWFIDGLWLGWRHQSEDCWWCCFRWPLLPPNFSGPIPEPVPRTHTPNPYPIHPNPVPNPVPNYGPYDGPYDGPELRPELRVAPLCTTGSMCEWIACRLAGTCHGALDFMGGRAEGHC